MFVRVALLSKDSALSSSDRYKFCFGSVISLNISRYTPDIHQIPVKKVSRSTHPLVDQGFRWPEGMNEQ